MNDTIEFFKNTWTFWGLMIFAIGFTVLIVGSASAESIPEIDQNQVVDEISQTIRVNLHDGISSSDELR